MEALQTYRVKVVSFQLASGYRRWFIVRCYLAPDDASTIGDVIAAIVQRPQGAALLMVGDFNTDLAAPEGREWDKGITADMVEEGLEDISGHFFPRHKLWLKDGQTWAMQRGGREVRSRTD